MSARKHIADSSRNRLVLSSTEAVSKVPVLIDMIDEALSDGLRGRAIMFKVRKEIRGTCDDRTQELLFVLLNWIQRQLNL